MPLRDAKEVASDIRDPFPIDPWEFVEVDRSEVVEECKRVVSEASVEAPEMPYTNYKRRRVVDLKRAIAALDAILQPKEPRP